MQWVLLMQGLAMRAQRKASKQERLLVQSIAAASATMEAPARPTDQAPGKAVGKPATQKPTVSSLSRIASGATAELCVLPPLQHFPWVCLGLLRSY